MKEKKTWQINILLVCYIIGCIILLYTTLQQEMNRENVLQIIIPNLYFIILIVALFIRRPWSFFLSVILLSPIIFISLGASRLILGLLFVMLFPLLVIAYLLFCPATLRYFRIKKERSIVKKHEVEIENPNDLWECPNCNSNNLNTKFVCDECGYHIV
jgi:hypothetical protein